jgi:hypothetical protein
MFDGYRIIFWGIFFITFHINLGPIAILPAFIGYMTVSRGIDHLQKEFESPYFQKARNTSMLLTILGLISFVLIWAPQQQSIAMSYYPLLFSILELFLVCFILEGSIDNFISMGSRDLARDYRNEQRTYIVFMTIYIIGMCIAITLVDTSFAFVMILIGLFLRLWLMVMLGRLKREQPDPSGITTASASPEEDNIFDEYSTVDEDSIVGVSSIADQTRDDSQNHFDEKV